jgi:hypothetical protein
MHSGARGASLPRSPFPAEQDGSERDGIALQEHPKPNSWSSVTDEALPAFLEALDGRDFYLLTPFSESPVRLAAIDLIRANFRVGARFEPVYRTRILDLNVDDSVISEGAERILFGGASVDTIAFRNGAIVLAKNEGSPDSDIEVTLYLNAEDPGNFCDSDLPEMGLFTSEKIEIAIDDLDSGDALQWHAIDASR